MFGQTSKDEEHTIACLHSSGGSGRQWDALRSSIGNRYDVLTPNLIGYGRTAFPFGRVLHMEDEVELVAGHIRAAGGRAHLVGHSYGGSVAVHVALRYPDLVASLSVFEPVLFSILYAESPTSSEVLEIERVADSVISQLDTIHGRWQGARDFINYWAGSDAWRHLENYQHARFASLMPKVAAEFKALKRVGTTAQDLAALQVPLRLACGTATRKPARRIVELIAACSQNVDLVLIDGVGHMAPVTHADVVNPVLIEHIGTVAAAHKAVA